jgi:alkylhydroperoxidase family enzyme
MVDERLAPLPPREWPAEMRAALAPLTPPVPRPADQPKGLNLLGTFARHPELVHSYHVFVAHLLYRTTLTARHRELLILRVAAVRSADYEWAQHVVLALDVGLHREEIDAVRADADRSRWEPTEAALLAAADELVADARITDETWRVLRAELSDQQLLDVVFTVGAYDVLAMALHTFGVQLDDDLLPWAEHP